MISVKSILFFVLLSGSICSHAQNISWTAFEDLNDSLSAEAKPLMIYIHADWCKYCLMQEQTTFKDSAMVTQLQNYYCLKLNSEAPKDIDFLGRTFSSKKVGDKRFEHDLVSFLADNEYNQIVLPTTVFLDENLTKKTIVKGVLKTINQTEAKK